MYTIIMNKDKSLTTTERTNIYQRDKLADNMQFLFPQTYGLIDLTQSIITLAYVDQGNIPHVEVLQKDLELYKDKVRCTLPVDTALTRFAGDIVIYFSIIYLNTETQEQQSMHTGEATIKILPLKNLYGFVPDESLDFVDQLVMNLEAKIQATEKIAETYDREKADNITYEGNKLQLTSNGEKIGDSVSIGGGSCDIDGVPVIDFSEEEPGTDVPGGTEDYRDVVEF